MLYRSVVRWGKITIVGVGLLGGSLGLAIRKRRLAKRVVGVVRRKQTITESRRKGAVDEATLDVSEGVNGADLVILCTPILRMKDLALALVPSLKKGAIVTDVGSVKTGVVRQLEPLCRRAGAFFVGSHPMAGSENAGVKHASANLFQDAVCAVTPTRRTSRTALRKTEAFWRDVGSRVLRLTPQEHDRLVSRSSHLPHLAAAALADYVLEPSHSSRQGDLCSTGFKDTTRVASGSPQVWRDILVSNSPHISRSLRDLIRRLERLHAVVKRNDADAAHGLLERAKQRRDAWCSRSIRPE